MNSMSLQSFYDTSFQHYKTYTQIMENVAFLDFQKLFFARGDLNEFKCI